MRQPLIDQRVANRFVVAPDHHQVAPVPILAVQAVRDHFKLSLIQQGSKPVGCPPSEIFLTVALRREKFWSIDARQTYASVAQFECITIDHAGRPAAGPARSKAGRYALRRSRQGADRGDQGWVEKGSTNQ